VTGATEAFADDLTQGPAKYFGDAAPVVILGEDETSAELG
jgi:hypothetical protein